MLLDAADNDLLLARVTTHGERTALDVPINDWRAAGLLAPSTVRLHKLATIEKKLVQRPLGKLAQADRDIVTAALKDVFLAW